MADLGSLDPTQPDGAVIVVAQLDDFERETRAKIIDWAETEHSQYGHHALPIGDATARDAYYTAPEPVTGNTWILNSGPGIYQMQVYHLGGWRTISAF